MESILINGQQAKQRIQKLIENYDQRIHNETKINKNQYRCSNYWTLEQRTKIMKILIDCSLKIDKLIIDTDLVEKNLTWMSKIFSLNKQIIDINYSLENLNLPNDVNEGELYVNFRNQLLLKLQKHRQKLINLFVKFLLFVIENEIKQNNDKKINDKMINNLSDYLNNVLQGKIEPNLEYIVHIWNQFFIVEENNKENEDKIEEELNDMNYDKQSVQSDEKSSSLSSVKMDHSTEIMSFVENEPGFSLEFSFSVDFYDDDEF